MNLRSIIEQLESLSAEETVDESKETRTHKGGTVSDTATGKKHTGKYGTDYQGDDEDEGDDGKKKSKKSKSDDGEPKRGRGRPRKGADSKTGEVKKYDFSPFFATGKDVKQSKWKGSVTKHRLTDWIEHVETTALVEADQITISPASQNTQVIKQGNKVLGSVENPALANTIKQAISKGEMQLAGDDVMEDNLDEKINLKKAKMGDVVKDFYKSDAPQFKGKTKAERREMAIAAKLGAERKLKEGDELQLDIPGSDKMDDDQRHTAIMKKYPNAKRVGKTPGGYSTTGKNKADLVSGIRGVRKIKEYAVNESVETVERNALYEGALSEVEQSYPYEAKQFREGWGMDQNFYEALCNHYHQDGRIPSVVWHGPLQELRDWVEECYARDSGLLLGEGDNYELTQHAHSDSVMSPVPEGEQNLDLLPIDDAERLKQRKWLATDYKTLNRLEQNAKDRAKHELAQRIMQRNQNQEIDENLGKKLATAGIAGTLAATGAPKVMSKYDTSAQRDTANIVHRAQDSKQDSNRLERTLRSATKKEMDKTMYEAKENKKWIKGAIKDPGAFTKKAKRHGMTTSAFAKKVIANPEDYPSKTEKQAHLAQTLSKMNESYEEWNTQLAQLLAEGQNVSISLGNEHGPDTVTVTATDEDAHELVKLLQNAGMGGTVGTASNIAHAIDADGETTMMSAPAQEPQTGELQVVDFDAAQDNLAGPEEEDKGDEALGFLKRMLGQQVDFTPAHDDAVDVETDATCDQEEATADGDFEQEESEEDSEQEVKEDEVEEGNKFSGELAKAKAAGHDEFEVDGKKYQVKEEDISEEEHDHHTNEEMCSECGGTMYEGQEHTCEGKMHTDADKLDEWANSTNDRGSDEAFQTEIEYMTKLISGGLNGPKRDQTVAPKTQVKVVAEGDNVVDFAAMKRLAGIK